MSVHLYIFTTSSDNVASVQWTSKQYKTQTVQVPWCSVAYRRKLDVADWETCKTQSETKQKRRLNVNTAVQLGTCTLIHTIAAGFVSMEKKRDCHWRVCKTDWMKTKKKKTARIRLMFSFEPNWKETRADWTGTGLQTTLDEVELL